MNRSPYKMGVKFFLKKLLLLTPILLIVILVNFTIDPVHLFQNGRYEKDLASYILAGKNVSNVSDYDVLLFQRYLVEGLTTKKDVVVLGPSRTSTINSDLFPKKSFLNNSIYGGSVDDFNLVYQTYVRKKLIPSEIIIGIDPWMLNRNMYSGEISKKNSSILKIAKSIGPLSRLDYPTLFKYYQLVSPSYFQSSFSKVWAKYLGRDKDVGFVTIDDKNDIRIDRYADGSANLKKLFAQSSRGSRELAQSWDPVPLLGGFYELDQGLKTKLENLVDQMKKDGVTVVFYLPPYHPLVYKKLVTSSEYKIIIDAQNYLVEMAGYKGIKVYGSYNPADFDLNESDFYDGTHGKETLINKVFKAD